MKEKLEEKDKLLRLQDNTKILDNILNSQRSPTIKFGLSFHESVEEESSSQGEARNCNEKSEMINKEMRGQPHQLPWKEILQRKYFTRNCGSNSWLFSSKNDVECFICHNFGHIVAKCGSRIVQDNYTQKSSNPRYFKGYYFA